MKVPGDTLGWSKLTRYADYRAIYPWLTENTRTRHWIVSTASGKKCLRRRNTNPKRRPFLRLFEVINDKTQESAGPNIDENDSIGRVISLWIQKELPLIFEGLGTPRFVSVSLAIKAAKRS